jgi:diguanylate cyclase (GGDEF)-like protein
MSIATHALLTITQDQGMVETLRELLGADLPVLSTPSVREAITEIQEQGPALVLMDAKLAGLDIHTFCQALKGDPRTSGIPVILIASSDKEAIRGLEQGANDYLLTPLQPIVARTRLQNYADLGRCLEALQGFSLVDGMTGIANRRRFDDFLTLEWRRNLRNGTPLSIVLMDLDHFRAYNEYYGARTGEDSLKRVATAFQEATQRPGDLVAFYSKGRFACILPETDTLGAVSVAERMRAELATLAIPHAKSSAAPTLTLSVGAATRVPTGEMEPEGLIALAERSLVEAKRAGRDRVRFTS